MHPTLYRYVRILFKKIHEQDGFRTDNLQKLLFKIDQTSVFYLKNTSKNTLNKDVQEKTGHICKMTKRGQEILEHLEKTQKYDFSGPDGI